MIIVFRLYESVHIRSFETTMHCRELSARPFVLWPHRECIAALIPTRSGSATVAILLWPCLESFPLLSLAFSCN